MKNFCDLANKGFYEGLKFHRVIVGFVAQGGCQMELETEGGYTIDCETQGSNQYHDKGVLSMAHAELIPVVLNFLLFILVKQLHSS